MCAQAQKYVHEINSAPTCYTVCTALRHPCRHLCSFSGAQAAHIKQNSRAPRGVCSKQNWYSDLPRPEGPALFSRLIHASGPRPTKAGSPLYLSAISCLRLPGPFSHTSIGACGQIRWYNWLMLTQRRVGSVLGCLGV